MASRCACCLRSTVCCLPQEAVALRLHAQSNFLARADCSEMRLPIEARRAPSEGYRDSGLVQSPFRDALIASRHHFRYWRKAAGRYRQCMSAGGAPTPPLQRRDGRRALCRNPRNRLTPVRRATRPTTGHKKPDPCASVVGFLSRVHMGPV